MVVLPSLPKHDHGEGVEFAIFQEGGAQGCDFLGGNFGELTFGVGHHGCASVADRLVIEKALCESAVIDTPLQRGALRASGGVGGHRHTATKALDAGLSSLDDFVIFRISAGAMFFVRRAELRE